ncbi:MAG: hypothetical protein Q9187_006465, partial [Circinaria calcarea]
MRHIDTDHAILEEEEDETSSEPAEAITPTTDSHPPAFTHFDGPMDHHHHNAVSQSSASPMKPLMVTSPSTPSAAKIQKSPSSYKAPPVSSENITIPPKRSASNTLRNPFRRSSSNKVAAMQASPFNLAMNG